ncbi:hypothetical protein MHYP_G00359820 [Metynnis hypsauchen]
MSCLWSWCCQVREDPDSDSESKKKKQNGKRKKGKKKKSWRIELNKDRKNKMKEGEEGDEETRQPDQRPGKVEGEADALDLPVGLKSSSHKNVSAEALKITAPPLQENIAEEADETIKSLTKTLLVEAQMEQLLETEQTEMEAAEATDKMKTSHEKPLQKHLDHLESSDEVHKAICELLDVLFEDVLSASAQPLETEMISKVAAEDEAEAEAIDALMSASVKNEKEEQLDKPLETEMISKVAAEDEAEAEAIDALMSASVKNEKEEQLDKPLDDLVRSDGVVNATCELLDIQLENPASVQPLENEAVMTEAAEGTDKTKSICLESSEEKPLQKHLDHQESSDEVVKAICELLDVLFEDVLSASAQPLETEMISKVAAEDEAEAIDALMSASVKNEKEEQLDKPLDDLVRSDGVVNATCELLDIQLENPASVQPLAENEMISHVAAEAEAEAEAVDALMSDSVKDKEEHLNKPLDHVVSCDDVLKVICELLNIQLEKPASVQLLEASKDLLVTSLEDVEEETEEKPEEKPLEKDVICTRDAEAQPEATTDTPNVYLEETQAKDNQLLTEMDVKKRDPPEEEAESRKRKTRRGTRGKGRKINYNKDKDPPNPKQDDVKNDRTVCEHRGRAQGVRGQHLQDKRKTPPETPKPTTDFQQHMTHDRRQRTQQVFLTRQSTEQDIEESNAVPHTLIFYRTGWGRKRRSEGPRAECTPPPRTDISADGEREKRGGKPRPKRPHWYHHDDRV